MINEEEGVIRLVKNGLKKLSVLFATEGTYPFHQGGVSIWSDILTKRLDQVEFVLYSVIMNPFVTQKFSIAAQASLISVPLWGTEEPGEHLPVPFSKIYMAKKNTEEGVIKERFLPLFRSLMEEILSVEKRPEHFASLLKQMYEYFNVYEYKVSFKSERVYETYKEMIYAFCRRENTDVALPEVYDLLQSLGWIYRFLNILNTPIPKTDVAHSSAAAFCGIPCVLSKLIYGTPYLLTEHGIYLREQYLSLSRNTYSPFLRTFLVRFIHSIITLNYAYADQISPVCHYNARWELQLGVNPAKIKVIYNGVDPNVFYDSTSIHRTHPTIVTVARIDPIKDLLTLIRAAKRVHQEIRDVRFMVYGEISVPEYYEDCLQLRDELGLKEVVHFAGHMGNIASVYHEGDVVLLSSISEGFPYSVIEAMMSGKPVVATDVGGVREALGEAGILVPPRDHEKMADEIVHLLRNPMMRADLGKEARERALNLFTLEKMLARYMESYEELSEGLQGKKKAELIRERAKLYLERGFSFKAFGMYEEAIHQLKLAIFEEPLSPVVPWALSEIAVAYQHLGKTDQALHELEKLHAYLGMLQSMKEESA